MEEKEITLRDFILSVREYCFFLLTKWKLIVIGGVVGGILGLVVSLTYHPKYKATVTILVDDPNSARGFMGLASSLGLGGGEQSPFSILNVLQLFGSRTIIEGALLSPVSEDAYNHRTYADLYIEEYELNKGWAEDSVLKTVQFKIGEDRSKFGREKDSILSEVCMRIIEDGLEVSLPDKKTSFIQVNVTTRNEVFSKNFSEELAKVIVSYYANFKTQKARESISALAFQIDSVRHSLYSSMSGAASSLDMVFGLNPSMSVQKINSAKEQAQVQMNIAVLQELVKSYEVTRISLLNNTPVIHIVDGARYPLEKKKIRKLLGLAVGGFLGGFLAIAYLLLKRNFDE